jgi:hypothetical protein
VGALPICGDDDRLHGIITDRDIVIKCVAPGRDPNAVTAGELAQGLLFFFDPLRGIPTRAKRHDANMFALRISLGARQRYKAPTCFGRVGSPA